MKKLVLIAIAALAMYSCGGGNKTTNDDATKVEVGQDFKDEHNARNSLSYHGRYEGTIPAASGPGIKVVIQIPDDSTYTRSQVYIGHEDQTFTDNGKYTWNEAGNTITLLGDETPTQYFVGESRLIMLDTEGNKITSELAEHYVLLQTDAIEYDLSKDADKK